MTTNKLKKDSIFLSHIFPKCKLLSFALLTIGLSVGISLGETPGKNELLDQRPGTSSTTSNSDQSSRPGVSGQSSRPGVSGQSSRPGISGQSSRPGISGQSSRPGIGDTVGLRPGISLSRPGLSAASRPGIERDQALGVRQVGEANTQAKRVIVARTGPEVQLEVADSLVEKGKLTEAIATYKKIIEKNPELAAAYAALGYAYIQTEDFDEAIENLTIAIEKNENDADAQLNLGVALYKSGDTKTAIEQYEKLVKAKSPNPEVYYNFGVAYAHEGEFEKAIEQINIAINKQKNKKYPEAYNNLGLVYEAMGDINKAIELLQTAIDQRPDYAIARYNLARLLLNKAADKDGKLIAIKQYEKAIVQDPKFAEAYLDLGNANLFLSVHSVEHVNEKAIDAYTKALELRKGLYPLAHENMAIAYSKKGNKEEALKHYYLAFEQYDGRCPEALQNMISTLNDDPLFTITNELLKTNNAGSLLNKKSTSKTNSTVNGSVEEIFFRTMKNLVSYENIDDEKKDNAMARYCGGRAYAFVGDWESATKEFTQALLLAKKEENKAVKAKGKEDNEQINVSEDAQRALITIASNNLVAIVPQ